MYNIYSYEERNKISNKILYSINEVIKELIQRFINDVKATISDDVGNYLSEEYTNPNLISYDIVFEIDATMYPDNCKAISDNFKLLVIMELQSIEHIKGFPIYITPSVEWDIIKSNSDHMSFTIQFMYRMDKNKLFKFTSQYDLLMRNPIVEIKPDLSIPKKFNCDDIKTSNFILEKETTDLYQHNVGDDVLKTKAIEFIREVTLSIYMDENLKRSEITFNFDNFSCIEKGDMIYYEYCQPLDPYIKRLRDEKGINIINIIEYLFKKSFTEIIIEQTRALYWYNIESILKYYGRDVTFTKPLFHKAFTGKAYLHYNPNEKFPTKIVWESNGCELTQRLVGNTKK